MDIINFFNLINNIDVDFKYDKLAKAITTKKGKIILPAGKNAKEISDKLNSKNNKKNKKLIKKKKDIVKIIDDSDKFEDELDKNIRDVTLTMDGFERFHLEQYGKQLEQYKRFLDEYLNEANGMKTKYDYEDNEQEKNKRNFEWGQEVSTYAEIKDIVRRVQMNAVMGGNHNGVTSDEQKDYEFWKYASKFNLMMSFILYDSIST